MRVISLAVAGAEPMRALDGKPAINGNGFPRSVALRTALSDLASENVVQMPVGATGSVLTMP